MIVTRGLTYVPIVVLGFSETALMVYVLIVAAQATFIHANVRWELHLLRRVIATPAFHHWHHANEPEAIDKNFAVHTPVWDRLFGTYYLPDRGEPAIREHEQHDEHEAGDRGDHAGSDRRPAEARAHHVFFDMFQIGGSAPERNVTTCSIISSRLRPVIWPCESMRDWMFATDVTRSSSTVASGRLMLLALNAPNRAAASCFSVK